MAAPEQNGVRLASLLAGSTPESLVIMLTGASAPLRARTTLAFDAAALERVALARQQLVVMFENGDPALPIVTGVLHPPPPTTELQNLLARGATTPRVEARLDGKRVVLEGSEEVVLKCGDASITLRRDGKLILRGAYVETNARGVNRIKGGSVKIN